MKHSTKTAKHRFYSFLVLLGLMVFVPSTAYGQVPGTNGRIIWSAETSAYTMNATGGDLQNTSLATIGVPFGSWEAVYSNNAQFILYLAQGSNGNANIFAINSALSTAPENVSLLTDTNQRAREPAVSPDNSRFAYVVIDTVTGAEIWANTINASSPFSTGATPIQLTDQLDGFDSFNPVWSPTSTTLYLRNNERIVAIDASTSLNTTGTVVVPDSVQELGDIDPTGVNLLYTKFDDMLYTWNISTSTETQITSDADTVYISGYYSPDGTKIVAYRINTVTDVSELVIMNADGTNITVIDTGSVVPDQSRPMWAALETTPTNPVSCSLSVLPASLSAAGEVVLSWQSTNANTITVDRGVGTLSPVASGSMPLNITATTTLTATAIGDDGQSTCSTTIPVSSSNNNGDTPLLPNAGTGGLIDKNSPILYVLIVLSGAAFVVLGKRIYKKQFTKKISQSHE